ncbi:MAG TPA: hypothetical protein VF608_14715 [Thermoanaerobaculia bacterium]
MVLLLLLLALGAPAAEMQKAPPVEKRGEIFIKIEPGVKVLLDGVEVGTSGVRDGGLYIRSVRSGKHKLTLQVKDGGAMDVDVEVFPETTTPVSVSSLTLRASARRRKSDVEVRVESDALECTATMGRREESITSPRAVLFEDVPTGSHHIAVSCGGRNLGTTVEVVPGRTLTVEADFRAKTMRVINDRPRVKELVVRSSRDMLVDAQIPSDAKRALIAALRPTIEVLGTYDRSDGKFVVRLESRYSSEISQVGDRLRKSGAVKKVEMTFVEELERPIRVRMDLIISFY